ncbi:hypothetical protein JZ751_029940 [Albula glossodonta]|uniref:Secreted protein n=1 Tax=Albula glossodonta TaxID=121402 RepID=A0A8T2MR97_9TELE|nr:hypothetical protein JZ751_029940 [Albula glossodonta]
MGFKKLKSNSWALCLAILLSWSGSAPQPLAEESGGIQPARCFIGRKVCEPAPGLPICFIIIISFFGGISS